MKRDDRTARCAHPEAPSWWERWLLHATCYLCEAERRKALQAEWRDRFRTVLSFELTERINDALAAVGTPAWNPNRATRFIVEAIETYTVTVLSFLLEEQRKDGES